MNGNVVKAIGALLVVSIPLLIKACDTSAFKFIREVPPTVLPQTDGPLIQIAESQAKLAAEAAETAANEAAGTAIVREGTSGSDTVQHQSLGQTSSSPTNRGLHVVAPQDANSPWKLLPGETVEQIRLMKGIKLEKVQEPHLIAAFPTDDSQFSKVYLQTPSASSTKEMHSLTAKLPTAATSWEWTKFSGRLPFSQELKGLQKADLVGIIAHSEDEGRTLVLPNGTRIDFAKLHEICSNQGKVCIVLSCFSDDLKIKIEITTAEALTMWNSAIKKWQKEPTWGSDEFIAEIRQSRTRMINRRKIYLSTVVGTGVIGGGYQLTSSRQQ